MSTKFVATCPAVCCPKCGCLDLKVLETRVAQHFVRRRKYCSSCHTRFTTREVYIVEGRLSSGPNAGIQEPKPTCQTCLFWEEKKCSLGFPEAHRSKGCFAKDCSLYDRR